MAPAAGAGQAGASQQHPLAAPWLRLRFWLWLWLRLWLRLSERQIPGGPPEGNKVAKCLGISRLSLKSR